MNEPTATIDEPTATADAGGVIDNQIVRITEDGLAERIFQDSNVEVVNY